MIQCVSLLNKQTQWDTENIKQMQTNVNFCIKIKWNEIYLLQVFKIKLQSNGNKCNAVTSQTRFIIKCQAAKLQTETSLADSYLKAALLNCL